MNEKLWADPDKCTGCGICELVCSLHHEGQWTHALSRVQVLAHPELELFIPLFCQQCEEPPCETACLMNVIDRNETSGRVERQHEGCIGCRACEVSCPLVGCFYLESKERVLNCDLCDGDPQCVTFCPEGALTFSSSDSQLHDRKRQRYHALVSY